MSKTGYSILYSLFFIIASCLGGVSLIGPVSYRHVIVAIMLIYLIINKKVVWDKYFSVYSIFILFYFICSSLTGYLQEGLVRVISYYLVCYIAYCSTYFLVSQYKNEKLLFFLFILLGTINALVTVGQFSHNPIATQITDILNLSDSEYLEDIEGRTEIGSHFYMPGIFGVVYNGYMSMLVCIMSAKYQAGRFRLLGVLLSVLLMVACFMVQERSSFALGIVLTVYLIGLSLISIVKRKTRLLGGVIAIILLVTFGILLLNGYEMLMSGESRMALVGLESYRGDIYSKAINYILDNPIIPGIERFTALYNTYPHSLFYNAYIYSGPIGFIAILILLINMFKKVFPYFFKSITNNNGILIVFCFSFLAYNINSLVHNNSFITGDMVLWIIWACIIALIKRERFSVKAS